MAKKAIVMGATSGIGMEVAKLLAAKGWQVGIAGRRIERLQALISQSGITCYQQIDVTSPNAPAQLLELIDKLGGMDLYFHSSGIGWQNNTLDIEKELKTVETNGLGFTRMVDTAFNWFATHHHCNPKARIACITSIAGTKGLGSAPAYSATKRFQNTYIEALDQLAHINRLPIVFTDIRPGFVATPLLKDDKYPLLMNVSAVAAHIINALNKKKRTVIIDRRYQVLVFFWRLIPKWLWVKLPVKN